MQNALAKEHFDRIDNAPERRRTGKNKDKYEMLPYPGNTLMDEADLKGMLRAMAPFIKHLNARGYMHFDLKPANLLYDIAPDGSKVFRVCDFNLAVKTLCAHDEGRHGTQHALQVSLIHERVAGVRQHLILVLVLAGAPALGRVVNAIKVLLGQRILHEQSRWGPVCQELKD